MSRRIEIFDTTLRDGNKLPYIVLSVPDRLEIARQLARLGVDVIDAGYPAASPEEREAVRRIGEEVEGPCVAALCRAIERDVCDALELLQPARRPYLHVFLPASERSLQTLFGGEREEILKRVSGIVRLAAGGRARVQFSLSEVGEAEPRFLLAALQAAAEAGASVVNLADTSGTLFPAEAAALVQRVRETLAARPEAGVQTGVGVHFHNDLGMATACTLAAVEAGADHLEVTVGGIGGRAGNTPLEEVVFGLEVLARRLPLGHSIRIGQLYPTARLLSRITGLRPHPNKPVIGRCALREPRESLSRRALAPWKESLFREETIGRPTERVPPGARCSPEELRARLEAAGIPLEGVDLEKACRLYRERFGGRGGGRVEVSLPELEWIAQHARLKAGVPYLLRSFNVTTGSNLHPVGVVEIEHEGSRSVHAAPGNGPMHALCRAVDRAVGISPRLILYSVDTLNEGMEALAEVTVTVSFKGRRFHGHFISADVIEAGLGAYLDAVNRLAASGIQEASQPFYVEGEHLWE